MEWSYKFEIDNEDEISDNENSLNDGTTGTIFLIDCAKFLFDKQVLLATYTNSLNSWFAAIIETCLSAVKNKAIISVKDHIGIAFFRVKTPKEEIMKNVHIFLELNQPEIGDIEKIMQLQSVSVDMFDKLYGFADECSIWHALWSCQAQFTKCKTKLDRKEIIMFTHDDNPCSIDSITDANDARDKLLVKIHDLQQSDIHLEIIPIGDQSSFNPDKFYRMVVSDCDSVITTSAAGDHRSYSQKSTALVHISDPTSRLKDLMTRTRHRQHHRKRAIAHIPLVLGDGLSIDVAVYNPVRKTPNLSFVPLDRQTNAPVDRTRLMHLKGEEDRLLTSCDIKYGLKMIEDNEMICFEKEEIAKMKATIEPGFRLLGFKPLKYLKPHYQVRPAQFIYPDESAQEDGSRLFAALMRRCRDRQLFGLCAFVPRKLSLLQLVALVPSPPTEKIQNDSQMEIHPPGFSVVFLPFKDDIRDLNMPLCDEVSESDRQISEELIQSLFVEYDPTAILNPALQKQLVHVEALALNLERPDKIEDNTVMEYEEVNQHCGSVLERYKEHFGLNKAVKAIKESKKPKIEVNLEESYKNGSLGLLTVAQLKEASNNLKIKLKGNKKADIIDSITAHFES